VRSVLDVARGARFDHSESQEANRGQIMPNGYEKAPDYGGPESGQIRIVAAVTVCALLAFGFFQPSSNARAQSVQAGTIVGQASVVDGDTVEIRGQRIRLWGIDAPEGAQSCSKPDGSKVPVGRRSAEALVEVIGDRNLTCVERDVDRYRRPVSVCRAGEVDVSSEMANRGWAWAFVRYSRDYVEQEQSARAAKLGVWGWECVAPWEYRTEQRRAKSKPSE
jgi:endonuclease YncB( thermonuclease family)